MRKNDKESEVPRTGHIYDGIEELDHPTPNWFQALFYGCIFFGVAYFLYFTINGRTLTQEYESDKTDEEVALYEKQSKSGGPKALAEQDLVAMVKDPGKIELGVKVFQTKCASCHGVQGQGGIGPNLTDEYWLHGGKMAEILKTITNGVSGKGMPPWGPMMSPDEIQGVTVFIRTLAGTHPAGAKAPQGEKIKSE